MFKKPEFCCAAKMPVTAPEGFPGLSEFRKMVTGIAVEGIMNAGSHKGEVQMSVSGLHSKKLFLGDDINQFRLFLHLLGKYLAH